MPSHHLFISTSDMPVLPAIYDAQNAQVALLEAQTSPRFLVILQT
jgi:hypothetical protein